MKRHNWILSWPGNFCKDCGMEDQFEACMGGCSLAPSDENGYPDPSKCPIHGPPMLECPPSPEAVNRFNQYYEGKNENH